MGINFIKNLPKKRIAAGVLFFNENNELLILKDDFKNSWTIPGGVVEKFESPLKGLNREIQEEIGTKIKIIKCLAIEWKIKRYGNYKDESLQMIFLGGKMRNKIKINNEITDYKFVKLSAALKLLNPVLSQRVKLAMKNNEVCIFLENGKRVL